MHGLGERSRLVALKREHVATPVRRRLGRTASGWRILVLGAAAALLSGCLATHSPSLTGSKRDCLRENAMFSDAWRCMKAQLGSSEDSKRSGFVEEGDILADQVRTGKVSESDARRRLSAGLSHEIGQ